MKLILKLSSAFVLGLAFFPSLVKADTVPTTFSTVFPAHIAKCLLNAGYSQVNSLAELNQGFDSSDLSTYVKRFYYNGTSFLFPGARVENDLVVSDYGRMLINGVLWVYTNNNSTPYITGSLDVNGHTVITGVCDFHLRKGTTTGVLRSSGTIEYSGVFGQSDFRVYNHSGDVLPVYFSDYSPSVMMIDFSIYSVISRRYALHTIDGNTNNNQCDVSYSIAKMWRCLAPNWSTCSNNILNGVVLDNPSDYIAYQNLQLHDYDNGGEIDIHEWACGRDRYDASDDNPECTDISTPDPEDPSEDNKATRVEVGPETREKYRNNQETAITAAVGDNSYISDPTIENFYITPPSYSPADGLDMIDEFQSAVESKLSSQDNYQKLQSLIQPLGSDSLPSYSLPNVEVSLGGSRSGSSSVSIDLSGVKLDFAAIQQNSDVWQILTLARSILACAIYFFTSWRIWKLFASLTSTGSLGSEASEDD